MYGKTLKEIDGEVPDENCFGRALYCQQKLAKLGVNFKIVVGSLGIGKNKLIFYEFGGLNNTHKKKEDFIKEPGKYDAHVWLEDSYGKIYDKVTGYIILCSQVRRVQLTFKNPTILEGVTKEELLFKGLSYVEAPNDIQCAVLQDFKNFYLSKQQ